jgi:putative redox protein
MSAASAGTDLGFSPEDLILSSIAMCKVATVLKKKQMGNWWELTANLN